MDIVELIELIKKDDSDWLNNVLSASTEEINNEIAHFNSCSENQTGGSKVINSSINVSITSNDNQSTNNYLESFDSNNNQEVSTTNNMKDLSDPIRSPTTNNMTDLTDPIKSPSVYDDFQFSRLKALGYSDNEIVALKPSVAAMIVESNVFRPGKLSSPLPKQWMAYHTQEGRNRISTDGIAMYFPHFPFKQNARCLQFFGRHTGVK